MNLTLQRHGTFDATVADGLTQCGYRGLHRFRYLARITVPDSGLDARGFVADHGAVHAYFLEAFRGLRDLPSCEGLAREAVAGLRRMCPAATRISVRIAGSDHASITAVWERPANRAI